MDEKYLIESLQNEAALSSTYGRGLSLARDGAVRTLDVTVGELGSTASLSGKVVGSRSSVYRTHVQLNLNEGEVIDYGCTCAAAENYPGMCKHEIALALAYLARLGVGPAVARKAAPPKRPAPAARRVAPTSVAIRQLMDELTLQRLRSAEEARLAHQLEAEKNLEPAELLLTLMPAQDTYYAQDAWCVKLRIRRGGASYVVKSVSALMGAYQRGDVVTYGKNLSFPHVASAFTEPARQILEILSRVVASQQALYASRWKYQAAGRGADTKELPVADEDIVALLDALMGGSIEFQENDGPYGARGRVRTLTVTEGDPTVRARISPSPETGYDLSISGARRCFSAGGRLYVIDDARARRCSPEFAARAGDLLGKLLPCPSKLHVAPADLPTFCRDVLPALRAATELDAPAELDDLVPPDAAFTFRIGCEDGLVTCDATVAYGSWERGLYGHDLVEAQRARWVPRRPDVPEPARDLVAEYRVMDAVEGLFPFGVLEAGDLPCFDEADDERLFDLLTRGLAELGELGEVLLSERLRSVRVRESPRLSVRATVTSGLLDVALDASGLSAQDLEAYLAAYKLRQRFVRLSDGDIMRLGESAAAAEELAEGLGVTPAELAEGVGGLPANRTLFVDALAKQSRGLSLSRNDEFRAIVRDFDTFADSDYEVPASLAGVLRPYQRDGFRWLQTLERLGFGGILADDMGLGKTLQMIAHILARRESAGSDAAAPTLVVCPASLVYNWMSELARFAPGLKAVAVLGAKAARRRIIAEAEKYDVLVTSYDLMKRDVADYEGARFARVVLDEAHYIKNPLTQVARAAKRLPAGVRFALTGTPIENRTAELWSIFDFLMPGLLGTRDAFSKAYEGPVEAGDEHTTERLRRLVSPFVLRRLKEDVLTDLPEKNESVVVARMTGEQEKLYRASQDRLARQIAHELPDEFKRKKLQVLAELTRLRQICCDPSLAFEDYAGGSAKLETCLELVAGALEGGHRILLFSQFTTMLQIISERLAAQGVAHCTLTGATSKEERRRLVERFQAREVPVFLISLRAGGVGLNLTAADVVIHYDPWWNLAAQNQATDRAHRIGQERAVTVFKLICADTIEERIIAMQESKRELAESLLSGEDVSRTTLTREDLLALLEG